MTNVVRLILGCLLCASICSCNGKPVDHPAQSNKDGVKVSSADAASNKELALKFLLGVQQGDKKKMYQAANLTPDLVNESREKLINSKQVKLSDKERLEYEHALRTSGNIDFFNAKLRKILVKSSVFQITQTTAKDDAADSKHFDHAVSITYNDKTDAVSDKTGKQVKSMVVHLQQIDRSVNGRQIHEFSFYSKDFEKMAERDFEVVSYF